MIDWPTYDWDSRALSARFIVAFLARTNRSNLEPKELEEPFGHVEPQIVAVAADEFVERRLIDAGLLGDLIDAQSALACGSAQDGGEAGSPAAYCLGSWHVF
jgi:hypothetical protein